MNTRVTGLTEKENLVLTRTAHVHLPLPPSPRAQRSIPPPLTVHREPPPAPPKLWPVWPARPTHIKRRVRAGSSHCWRLQRQRNNHHECKCGRLGEHQFCTSLGISMGFKRRMLATGKTRICYFLQKIYRCLSICI
jgi:hypothetical protein